MVNLFPHDGTVRGVSKKDYCIIMKGFTALTNLLNHSGIAETSHGHGGDLCSSQDIKPHHALSK